VFRFVAEFINNFVVNSGFFVLWNESSFESSPEKDDCFPVEVNGGFGGVRGGFPSPASVDIHCCLI
jgi:hypothetical protein